MTSPRLPEDIIRKSASLFQPELFDTVISLLKTYRGNEPHRVLRCILHRSDGDLDFLQANLEIAQQDYRDIIWYAEYDADDVRVNDFNKAFE